VLNRILIPIFLALVAVLTACKEAPRPESNKPGNSMIDPTTTGSIDGVVNFIGKVPSPVSIDMSQDPGCAIGNAGTSLVHPVNANHGHLADVYVYVKDSSNNVNRAGFPAPSAKAVIDQQGCRYSPYVLGVMVGQTIEIRNSDSTMHNVHPSPEKNGGWNVSQMPKGQPLEKQFDQAELMVPIKCNQHPWMKMYVHVSGHPFFAVTQADGKFQIAGLPPGEYTLAALHDRLGEKTLKVTVKPKQTSHAELAFAADAP
jgi:plastocyanin